MSSRLVIPKPPNVLAVLIGVAELAIIELFRLAVENALAWRRKAVISRGSLHLPSARRAHARWSLLISAVSVGLLVVVIFLELSITSVLARSRGGTVLRPCYYPSRGFRYFSSKGPVGDELSDPKLSIYLEEAGCDNNTLLESVLTGIQALDMGFPKHTNPPDESRGRVLRTDLFGCSDGEVANEGRDFHCDLMPVGLRNESTLEGTSFFGIIANGQESSNYVQIDHDRPEQRFISNTRFPQNWIVNSTANSVTIQCESNGLECYNLTRELVQGKERTVNEKKSESGVLIQVLNGNSTICLFENGMEARAEWLTLNHTMPNSERETRNGPVLVGFQVAGNARCFEGLSYTTARMYFDGIEKDTYNMPKDNMVGWLNKRVAFIGIDTESKDVTCDVYPPVDSSSIDRRWLVAAAVISSLFAFCFVVATSYSIVSYFTCPAKGDPLTPLWSIEELLRYEKKIGLNEKGSGDGLPQDVYVGVSEHGDFAQFAVYADAHFKTCPKTWLPFVHDS